jgi:hypothetical protein
MALTPSAPLPLASTRYPIEDAVGDLRATARWIAALWREEAEPEGCPAKFPRGTDALSPVPKLAAQTLRTSGPLSSQCWPVGVAAMKNRLHVILTEDGKINIIMSMYKKGARYRDIASETGLSISSVRYRLVELSYKGLVDFEPRYRSHTKRRK